MKKFILAITIANFIGLVAVGIALSEVKKQQENLGVAIPSVVALFETSLASSVTGSATSMTLASGTDKEGTSLSGTYGFIIDEGSSNEEFVRCSASGTALTSCARGLSVSAPASASAALEKTHRRGASVKITDWPIIGILQNIVNGSASVPNTLYYPGAQDLSTASGSVLVHKTYVDNVATAGAPDASLTIKGVVEFATTAQINETNGVKTGDDTTAWLVVNPSYLASSNYATYLPSQGQKNALAGSLGTPSTTNRYITEQDVASSSFATNASRSDWVIRSDGDSLPSALWVDITSFNITSSASGDLVYHNGTEYTRRAIGGNGNVLTASVSFPIWASPSHKVYLNTADVTIDNTVTETNLVSFTLNGKLLREDGVLRTYCHIDDVAQDEVATLTIKAYYGATSITTAAMTTGATLEGYFEFIIAGAGTTSSQVLGLVFDATNEGAGTALYRMLSAPDGTAAIDSTANQTVKVTGTMSLADAGNGITVSNCYAQLIK